jgi:hypothetical protein
MGCRLGPSTAQLVLRASPGPLHVVSGRARAGPNHAGRGSAHLPRAKFSGLVAAGLRSTHFIIGRHCASASDSLYAACAVGRPCADTTGHGSFCFGGDCVALGYNVGATLARPCGCFSPVSYTEKASIGGVRLCHPCTGSSSCFAPALFRWCLVPLFI